ncbi:Lipopolysaccharide export system ATP-binding protein LptB [Oligella ureolytica]|nr:Lipopolysaccharide export system ATP-binding protein LptB [Oligella ureolytica]
MLEVKNVVMKFGGLTAIDHASLKVKKGSITGLIGPNGAGKTTLFAVTSGFLKPTDGKIIYRDNDITKLPSNVRAEKGITRTFQIVQPFAGLNVLENIMVGAYLRNVHREDAKKKAIQIAELVGLTSYLERSAQDLTVSGRKRLEVARALATEPELILLDEVLAGLNPSELRDIIPVIRQIQSSGITILMIEHVMQAVVSLCDYVYVLNQGKMIAEGVPSDVVVNPVVIEAYLGQGATNRLAQEAKLNA